MSKKIEYTEISDLWELPGKALLTAADIFCGCGGLSKGLELAGIKVLAGLDYYTPAGQTYTRNFNHKYIHGDVKEKSTKETLYNHLSEKLKGKTLDILAGGFPCQGFSMSGPRQINDPRNSLYKELLKMVEKLQPKFLLFENVKGLISMAGGKVKEQIVKDFKDLGYTIEAEVLNSANYGVPQKRERVIFIGNRINRKNLYPLPILTPQKYLTTKNAIGDLLNAKEDKSWNHSFTNHTKEMEKRLKAVPEGQALYKNYSDSWKKCPWNEPSCTIKENHGGVNIHPKLPRVLTVRECARIQNFPDEFIFEGTKSKQLVQIGNAVPPNLAKAIGLAIRKSYEA